MNNNNYCVIMAGGIGSRFWPLSKSSHPKQFLDILNTGRTFIQSTFDRFTKVCPVENILVVTNVDYKNLLLEQLPQLKENQILLEPQRKNTAPCIAYANAKIIKKNPNANIIVAPSDHLILNETEFLNTINKGIEFVNKNNALLTIGIKPSRPETGYGYIQANTDEKQDEMYKVKTFTEKPDVDLAKIFLSSGDFYWNSGIFIWNINSINKAFEEHLPEVFLLFKENISSIDTQKEETAITQIYSECKNISIDYGIMEKADNVYVISADFGWSDLGTWGSLFENSVKSVNNNVIKGNNVLTYNSDNCIINVPNNKLVVVNGLSNFIVVESEDTILICQKDNEQQLRQIVNDVKTTKGNDFV